MFWLFEPDKHEEGVTLEAVQSASYNHHRNAKLTIAEENEFFYLSVSVKLCMRGFYGASAHTKAQ